MPMPPPMHFANFLSLRGGKYNVSWMHDTSMDTLHFMVEVMATGWIGLGFAKEVQPDTSSMERYDVAVAMVSASGQGTITVKYSTVLHWKVQWPMGNAPHSGPNGPGSRPGLVQCVVFSYNPLSLQLLQLSTNTSYYSSGPSNRWPEIPTGRWQPRLDVNLFQWIQRCNHV